MTGFIPLYYLLKKREIPVFLHFILVEIKNQQCPTSYQNKKQTVLDKGVVNALNIEEYLLVASSSENVHRKMLSVGTDRNSKLTTTFP